MSKAKDPALSKRRRFTDEENSVIVDLWRRGLDAAAIAAVVDRTPTAVKTQVCKLRKRGVALPLGKLGVDQITKTEVARRLVEAREAGQRSGRGNPTRVRVLELRLAGHGPKAIAEILGISEDRAKYAITDWTGQKTRRQPSKKKGTCVNCGNPTHTWTSRYNPATGKHDRVSQLAERCDSCAREHRWGRPQLTRESMITDVQTLAKKLGRVPVVTDLHAPDAPFSSGAPYQIFGDNGWAMLLDAAGLEQYRPPHTKQSMILDIQSFARRLDRTPKISDLSRPDAPFSAGPVWYIWGKRGWTKLLTEAGLVARKAGGQTRQDDKDTELTTKQRMTTLRIGGAIAFDGETVETGASVKDLAA
jgi:hypothetical protein